MADVLATLVACKILKISALARLNDEDVTRRALEALPDDALGVFVSIKRSQTLDKWPHDVHGCIGHWERDFQRIKRKDLLTTMLRVGYQAAWEDSRRESFGPLEKDAHAEIEMDIMLEHWPVSADGIIQNPTRRRFDNDEFGLIVQDAEGVATYLPQVYSGMAWSDLIAHLNDKAHISHPSKATKYFACSIRQDKIRLLDVVSKTFLRNVYLPPLLDFVQQNMKPSDRKETIIPYRIDSAGRVRYSPEDHVRNVATIAYLAEGMNLVGIRNESLEQLFQIQATAELAEYEQNPTKMRQASAFLQLALDQLAKMLGESPYVANVDISSRLVSQLDDMEPRFERGEALVSLERHGDPAWKDRLDQEAAKPLLSGKRWRDVNTNDVFQLNWESQFIGVHGGPRTRASEAADMLLKASDGFADRMAESNYLAVAFEGLASIHHLLSDATRVHDRLLELFVELTRRANATGWVKFIDKGDARLDITGHVLQGIYALVRHRPESLVRAAPRKGQYDRCHLAPTPNGWYLGQLLDPSSGFKLTSLATARHPTVLTDQDGAVVYAWVDDAAQAHYERADGRPLHVIGPVVGASRRGHGMSKLSVETKAEAKAEAKVETKAEGKAEAKDGGVWKGLLELLDKTHDEAALCDWLKPELERRSKDPGRWTLQLGDRLGAGAFGQVYGARATAGGGPECVIKAARIGQVWRGHEYTLTAALHETVISIACGEHKIGPRIYDAMLCDIDSSIASTSPKLEGTLDAISSKVFEGRSRVLFLVMERIVGKTLGRWILDIKDMPPPSMRRDIQQMMNTMHQMHIVHRDMHSWNVMVREQAPPRGPKPIIIDFGEATLSKEPPSATDKRKDWDVLMHTISTAYVDAVLRQPAPLELVEADEGKAYSSLGAMQLDAIVAAHVNPIKPWLMAGFSSHPSLLGRSVGPTDLLLSAEDGKAIDLGGDARQNVLERFHKRVRQLILRDACQALANRDFCARVVQLCPYLERLDVEAGRTWSPDVSATLSRSNSIVRLRLSGPSADESIAALPPRLYELEIGATLTLEQLGQVVTRHGTTLEKMWVVVKGATQEQVEALASKCPQRKWFEMQRV